VDDEQAISQLRAGDLSGLETLVKRYQSSAIETAYLITHDLPLAEDVAQDVFVRLYRSIQSFDQKRPFQPWLMRSVVNAAVKAARRAQRYIALDAAEPGAENAETCLEELLLDKSPGPEILAERAELESAIEEALKRLSPDQRAAIVLRYFLDLSDEDISEQLHCAQGTVRWRLHAARKQLGVWLSRFSPDHSAWSEQEYRGEREAYQGSARIRRS
jgi:RNA polymerase sigma-70 factor (ECF subfamily)